MEIHGNLMGHTHGNGSRDHQNGSNSWASIWELHSSRFELDWTTSNPQYAAATLPAAASSSACADRQAESGGEVLWLPNSSEDHRRSLYSGNLTGQFHPDPHLMCLKLGKRNYFEDSTSPGERHVVVGGGFSSLGKRGKALVGGDGGDSSSFPATVPRCQVEGCQVALVNAKDYHRRHKVCEMHSKAPKVVVLGLEQRFCQQCSRFHVVSEFDDSKRSCRRRLAGHNERRRKSSHDSLAKSCFQDNKAVTGRFPYCRRRQDVLSLFCHQRPNLSRSLEINALRELIAENRAAVIARQLDLDRDMRAAGSDHHGMEEFGSSAGCIAFQHNPTLSETHCWDRIHENGEHVTLDLMQAPNSGFGMLSVRGKSKEEEEDEDSCTGLWNSFHGGHVI